VASASVPTQGVIVIPPTGLKARSLPGAVSFSHPALDKRARLVPAERAESAKAAGCLFVSISGLVTRHLESVVYDLAHELLTRDATKQLIEEVRRTSPTVVDELIPEVMKLGEVQQVLRGLLREGVPIRQLSTILEALGDHATKIRDTSRLTEVVRKRLARTISSRYQDSDGLLHVVTLDPELEDQLTLATAEHGECLSLPQKMTFQDVLRKTLDRLLTENRPPVLLTKSDLRLAVRQVAQAAVPGVVVIGRDEVTPESQIRSVGIVGLI
jgi:flagellar biosynthesis protein FlhA